MTGTKTTNHTQGTPGKYVVIGLILFTAIVGGLFIYLGPKATEKTPGMLHVGIRYANEHTIEFTQYSKTGPGARIEFIAADGSIPHTVERLAMGRNLVPISNLSDGTYTVRLSSDDFETVELTMIAEGRMLNPPKDAEFPHGTHADYNMIGVRFEPRAAER
ncbi:MULTISPECIES: hypothetical protein [unclassified Lentimonas]|uniref:hypothetical protein n=1 Tax=unclassified Lentimonas TaxID=2630993 RepID=UPI001324046F|nr:MULTISPECIES: hypothetical protein [unclassified Lentimonas]CAA6693663.1 Unannotated [Lentimonas sp. CC10]CAA6696044.1 Unannotated [Lentimonas sp. CC19]CAA7071704.1 Unannotated [Lentimonas sp. CC11]